MAYQLQPGLSLVENPAVPTNSATDDVFVYPQPSSVSMGARPNTMLYGTAPAKFGKGAPAQYVDTSDRLRPQSTSTHNKQPIKTWERGIFPVQDKGVVLPPQSAAYSGPASTRADLQNGLFDKRYLPSK
tara:strand:- start:4738 stop:5124 length:387 start_codon:yes stop_codon:yes gene_type:complete